MVFNSQALVFSFSTSRPSAESRRGSTLKIWPTEETAQVSGQRLVLLFHYLPPQMKLRKNKATRGNFLLRNNTQDSPSRRLPVLSKPTYKCFRSLTFPSRHRMCVLRRRKGWGESVKPWELIANFSGEPFPLTVDESKKKKCMRNTIDT